MAEFPNTVTWKVRSPTHEVADLQAALIRLARNPSQRDRLGESARHYAATVHSPAAVAARYTTMIHDAMTASQERDGQWLADAANAVADSHAYAPVPGHVIEQWTTLRERTFERPPN